MKKSIKQMLETLLELAKCHELPAWPDSFVRDIAWKLKHWFNDDTTKLTGKQVEKIEQLYHHYYKEPSNELSDSSETSGNRGTNRYLRG